MWEELSVSEPGASPQTSAPLSSTTSPCAPPAAGCAFIYPSPPAFCLPSFPRAYLWPSPFSSRPPQPELGHCARLVAGAINLRGQRAAWWASRSPINFIPPDAGQLHLCRWWPPSSAAGAGWPWGGAPGGSMGLPGAEKCDLQSCPRSAPSSSFLPSPGKNIPALETHLEKSFREGKAINFPPAPTFAGAVRRERKRLLGAVTSRTGSPLAGPDVL